MSGCKKKGEGIQVVSVDNEGRYVLATESLRGVTARGELRGLPVAVVSVAGATRGGKSFLLNFMLRYLRATPAAQRDGTWIGGDNEPLEGFSWRGGWQRNTTGILLWSEPFVVTQQIDGITKKMVVLLMDTQGTFDNISTVRDCTTIFALSTLISSVQIYNLAQQVKEDDLQHLQLFTQYGKLALSESDAKPFQSLVFRIRDWIAPYEHPYGAYGGEKYLESILSINKTQNEELQELRRNIRDSFDTISCFLMPLPGYAVADQNFSGRLCDLRPEFLDSLLGFVPSILDSSNLIPKVINGQQIAFGDLLTYFNSYIEIFNSDELPTPVSILNATSSACLETTLNHARELYVTHMERLCGERSVPRDVITRAHAAATHAARLAVVSRRTLAAPERAAQRLDCLMQELEEMLPTYISLNEGKTQKLIVESSSAYEEFLTRIQGGQPLCLHPRDVSSVHARALAAALDTFDAGRQVEPGERDDDRTALTQSLETKLSELTTASNLSNTASQSQACSQYSASMQRAVRGGAVSAARLRSEHERAAHAALQDFKNRRSCPSQYPDSDDHFFNEVSRELEEMLPTYISLNEGKTQKLIVESRSAYEEFLIRIQGGQPLCLHPRDVSSVHARAVAAALDTFDAGRQVEPGERDDDRTALTQSLETKLSELTTASNLSNTAAQSQACSQYSASMQRAVRGGAVSAARLRSEHERAAHAALQDFKNRRSCPSQYPDSDDHFFNEVSRHIQDQFAYMESSNKGQNKLSKQAAIFSYNNHMQTAWGPNTCLHPDTLRSEHEKALKNALDEFCASANDHDLEEDIKNILKKRFRDLVSSNEASNDALVAESYQLYTHKMESKCTPSLSSLLIAPWLIKVLVMIPKYHQENRKAAVDHFRSKRRGYNNDDEYIDRLKSKCDEGYETFRHPLHALARELGIPTSN